MTIRRVMSAKGWGEVRTHTVDGCREKLIKVSVCPNIWANCLRNAFKEFPPMWHKCPLGLKEVLVRIWRPVIKVIVT